MENDWSMEIRKKQPTCLVHLYFDYKQRRNFTDNLHFVFSEEKKKIINRNLSLPSARLICASHFYINFNVNPAFKIDESYLLVKI